jgi:GT2 family glycosyltransferase
MVAVQDQSLQAAVNPESIDPLPSISVIVLNWNGAALLPCCLEALQAQTFRDFEVLILDNASTDGSVDDVETRWPDFRLVRFERNHGFSLANNRGAQMARGRWLVFLNNDAFPRSDWLQRLVEATVAWPDFSFFASRLVYADDSGRMQSAGDVCNISGFAWSRGNGFPVAPEYLEVVEIFSPCGAAAMYSRQAFLDVGGFNEDFVSHLEDVDLGFRLRLVGQRCLYIPSAVVEHVVSAAYGVESDRTVYQVQRNVIWMYFSDMPGGLFWKYLPTHLMANLIFLAYYSLRGRARAVWLAKLDSLRGLPAAIRRRRLIQRARMVSPYDIRLQLDHGWFSPYTLGRRRRSHEDATRRSASMDASER